MLLLLLAIIGGVWWRFSAHEETPYTPTEVAEELAPSGTVAASLDPPVSENETIPIPISAEELATVMNEYMVPGRMVFFRIVLDHSGQIELRRATGAIGRAKPGPLRAAPGYIRIDGYDTNDQLTFSQTAEDPTHRVLEHPASSDDGRLTRTVQRQESGILFLRIPGESRSTRLVLSRWSASNTWQEFSAIDLL
ncbi:MAG: hypothetical protein SynsKO_21170 [Synoicihabitans sp.]